MLPLKILETVANLSFVHLFSLRAFICFYESHNHLESKFSFSTKLLKAV